MLFLLDWENVGSTKKRQKKKSAYGVFEISLFNSCDGEAGKFHCATSTQIGFLVLKQSLLPPVRPIFPQAASITVKLGC